ncbi:MAG: RadC family protein [Candidatus Woesearchaeota archaeon]
MQAQERLLTYGAQSLTNAELIALIVRTGYKDTPVRKVSQLIEKLLQTQHQTITIAQLRQIPGIGVVKACKILALLEFQKRQTLPAITGDFSSAKKIFLYFQQYFLHKKQEEFIVVYLTNKLKSIAIETVFKGTLNSVNIHPREIYVRAIKHQAYAIIVVHNHPSGDPLPSEEDIQMTKTLIRVGELVGIPLLDHVIIGHASFWNYEQTLDSA